MSRRPTWEDLDEALSAIYELGCEAERLNNGPVTGEALALARAVSGIIEWCKTDKQPEWDERLAARRARAGA